jgi:hypothetical protein
MAGNIKVPIVHSRSRNRAAMVSAIITGALLCAMPGATHVDDSFDDAPCPGVPDAPEAATSDTHIPA